MYVRTIYRRDAIFFFKGSFVPKNTQNLLLNLLDLIPQNYFKLDLSLTSPTNKYVFGPKLKACFNPNVRLESDSKQS